MKNKRPLPNQHHSQPNKQSILPGECKTQHTSHQPHATLVHPCKSPPKSLKQSQKSFLPSMILSLQQTFISAPWTRPSQSLTANYFPLHRRVAHKSEKL